MNPESGKYLTQRILELDPDPAIDTCGPPEQFPPMSVIFSPKATINDDHMSELGSFLSDLEFLNVSQTSITDNELAALTESKTLKIITIQFGTSTDTINSLFAIPTLR